MKYSFPMITHINDVLPHIKGKDEFIVAERDGYKVINYLVQTGTTFSNNKILTLTNIEDGSEIQYVHRESDDDGVYIRRECRGLTFYSDGRIASRKFHKFYNLNEREETQFHAVDLNQPHVILNKMDGYMITPFLKDDNSLIQYHTKMGHTEIGKDVRNYVNNLFKKNINIFYDDFCFDMIKAGVTPIFEWTSQSNRIVVEYKQSELTLLAIRDNITGTYMDYKDLIKTAEEYYIPVVQAYPSSLNLKFVESVRNMNNIEGFVVRFDNGHMIKVKTEEYVKFHKTKESIRLEKNVWSLILDDQVDDLKSFLVQEDRERIEKFEVLLWEQINGKINNIQNFIDSANKELDSMDWSQYDIGEKTRRDKKKHFTLNWMPKIENELKGTVFTIFDGKDARESILKFVREHLGTKTKLDSVRHLFGNIEYKVQVEYKVQEID